MNVVTPEAERFYDRVLERVRALPGVERAGIASRLPFQVWTHPFVVVGKPAPEPGKEPQADFNEVDAQLLQTLDIRLLARPAARGARHGVRSLGGRGQQDLR